MYPKRHTTHSYFQHMTTFIYATHDDTQLLHISNTSFIYPRWHTTHSYIQHTTHSCLWDMSCGTYMNVSDIACCISDTRRGHIHIFNMNESCRTYIHIFNMNEFVAHTFMHLGRGGYVSCWMYAWVVRQIFDMWHVAHMIEQWRTYECVMSHIWMSHVAHMNESCRT